MSSTDALSDKTVVNSLSLKKVKKLLDSLMQPFFLPVTGIFVFLLFWSIAAQSVQTSLGQFPGSMSVVTQFGSLYDEHVSEREKAEAFFERQEKRNAARLEKDPDYKVKARTYTGKETFIDQIITSLITVSSGFLLAAVIAIPSGILIGLNPKINAAVNPIVQIFKPVSPLAWLPLVTLVVSAVYVSDDPMVAKSFINSLLTVTLCSLWPMVINTSIGVSSIESDLLNVSRVLRLPAMTHVKKIVLPSSIPMIFTGMRLSFGVAWMVLIAAEMLAQNPGLGKFVWDEFQNGSSESLSRIMAAIIVIGFIGFLLDRLMLSLQKIVSWDKSDNLI